MFNELCNKSYSVGTGCSFIGSEANHSALSDAMLIMHSALPPQHRTRVWRSYGTYTSCSRILLSSRLLTLNNKCIFLFTTLVVSFTIRDSFNTVAFHVIFHRLFSTFFSMAQQPLVGQGLLIIEAAPSLLRDTTFGRTPLDE
jgi:hypothetical protein